MSLKVLLVEDNVDARDLLAEVIVEAGFEVVAGGTVQEGLDHASSTHCDVLLSDVSLPDGTGHQLMGSLKDAGQPIYGIAMSGFGANSDIAASLAAGFRHHLVKPFELRSLEQLLETARKTLQ